MNDGKLNNTMIHHDQRDRETAKREAAEVARRNFERTLEQGRAQAVDVMNRLQREAETRRDYLVPARELDYSVGEDGSLQLYAPDESGNAREWALKRNARHQLFERLKVPTRFGDALLEEKPGRGILRNLLDDLRYRWTGERVLIRVVPDDETDADSAVRALLSDSYAPFDQSELLKGFVDTLAETGALPQAGSYFTDERYGLRAMMPEMFEPIPDEPMVLGIQLSNSEYGAGSLQVQLLATRMWCTNTCIGTSLIRKVHLGGGALKDAGSGLIEWSQETLRLNSAAAISGMKDAMRSVFAPEKRQKLIENWRAAAQAELNAESTAKELVRKGVLRKADQQMVVDMVREETRREVLPATPSRESKLRFAQALSWVAQGKKSADERLLLEREAGRLSMAV